MAILFDSLRWLADGDLEPQSGTGLGLHLLSTPLGRINKKIIEGCAIRLIWFTA